VLTNIQAAIKEIQEKITTESAGTLDECHEHYLAGLSDALGIIADCANKDLTVGNTYYVIMPLDSATNQIIKMRLYKITQKRKFYYSFTNIKSNYPQNDLTLSSAKSLKLRVFDTEEEAEKNKDIMIWRSELRNPFDR
jgi:hypothetical protein